MRPIFTLAVLTASISSVVVAQTERDLDSHEHGAAALNVALDGESVFIELESPWNNLVGFEHAPGNDEQHAKVDDAVAKLEQPQQLFSFVGSECTLAKAAIESSLGESEHDDHDDHDEDKDHDDHDDHDKDEDHDDHDKDEDHAGHDDHDDHDEETHSAVLVMYEFNCTDIGKLSAIDVELLEIWSGFEKLDVQLIGPGGQTAIMLNPQERQLNIKAVQ